MSKITLTAASLDFDGKDKLNVRDFEKILVGELQFEDIELRDKYSEDVKQNIKEEIDLVDTSTNNKITIKEEVEKEEIEEIEEKTVEKENVLDSADDMII